MTIYSKARDTTSPRVRISEPRAQEPVAVTADVKYTRGPSPAPMTAPPLFSRTAPGIDPLTVEAWQ
jgi:hypothetical protein